MFVADRALMGSQQPSRQAEQALASVSKIEQTGRTVRTNLGTLQYEVKVLDDDSDRD